MNGNKVVIPDTVYLEVYREGEGVWKREGISPLWSDERIGPDDVEYRRVKSPWINVGDNLPDITSQEGESDYVLVRYRDCIPLIAKYCTEEYHVCPTFKVGNKSFRSHWITATGEWIKHNVTHWTPIPSFDEILDANKDVLKRLKEKGD